jgi:hypothetical protein
MHGLILTGFAGHSSQAASSKRTAGAHRIATYLRAQAWDIEVLDFVMAWELEQLKEFIRSRVNSKTTFIGFGGTFPIWSDTLDKFFKWFKISYPNISIIAGGQISNLYKIEADWYVDGFGERALEALLKHITSNEPVKYQLGINGRKIIKGNTDYPSYPMADLRIRYEDRDFILSTETLTTELGRGCIFSCSFCNFPILGVKTDHSRDASNLYDELLENYERFGVTRYYIADETVNDYSAKLEKFAKVIKDLPFRPRLYGFARADLLVSRPHDWDTMIEMGFVGHHYGIESTNIDSLKVIGKGMHPDKLLPGLIEARQYFKKYSEYKSELSLIAGLPYETRDSLQKTIEWVHENWKTECTLMFPLYIPKLNLDQASKLAFNHTKYGYRETKTDLMPEIVECYSRIPAQYGVGEGLIEYTGMSWETDDWNVLDAMKIVMEFYKTYPNYSGMSMWKLGEYEHLLGLSYNDLADKTMTELLPLIKDFDKKNKEFLDSYIAKKLNWKNSLI